MEEKKASMRERLGGKSGLEEKKEVLCLHIKMLSDKHNTSQPLRKLFTSVSSSLYVRSLLKSKYSTANTGPK